MATEAFEEIAETFEFLDDWEDRYRYVIELGRKLEPLPDEAHNAENKVLGCASQVWLETHVERSGAEPTLSFLGDSDAMIVKGLIAILLTLFNGKTAREIVEMDTMGMLADLGLDEHLSPQRSNGLASMVARIKSDAEAALEPS